MKPIIDGRYPTFRRIRGGFAHELGGARRTLMPGETVAYRRHGSFRVVGNGRGSIWLEHVSVRVRPKLGERVTIIFGEVRVH